MWAGKWTFSSAIWRARQEKKHRRNGLDPKTRKFWISFFDMAFISVTCVSNRMGTVQAWPPRPTIPYRHAAYPLGWERLAITGGSASRRFLMETGQPKIKSVADMPADTRRGGDVR